MKQMPVKAAEGRAARRRVAQRASASSDASDALSEAQKAIRRAKREEHERALAECMKRAGLPVPQTQYAYLTGRRVRADFAFPLAGLLIEVQGGVYAAGRHTRGAGYTRDRIKYAEAQLAGWIVIEVTPDMIADGRAIDLIERALMARHGIKREVTDGD